MSSKITPQKQPPDPHIVVVVVDGFAGKTMMGCPEGKSPHTPLLQQILIRHAQKINERYYPTFNIITQDA